MRPVVAQTGIPCLIGGPDTIEVEITEPAEGERVSGVIPVRGRVQASPGVEITRIEISMGNVGTGGSYQPASSHTFDYRIDTTRLPKGPMTLLAAACDWRESGIPVARGRRQITVVVTEAEQAAPPTAPEEGEGPAAVAGAPAVVLREAPDDAERDRPIWIGVVVGLSGAVGLGLAAALQRRRGPPMEEDAPAGTAPDPVPVE